MLHILLQLLNKALYLTSIVRRQIGVAISHDNNCDMIDSIKEQLLTQGGMDQLLLFLTGTAGAGKTTAIKAAERSCYEFFYPATLCGQTLHSFILHIQDWLYQHLEELLLRLRKSIR